MLYEQKVPPSGRGFEVFSAVILAGKSTREAAAAFQLSQTRVCQIVERVRKWQAEVVGTDDADNAQPSEEQRMRLARCIAAGRLDHLYGESMEAWRRSQGELKKRRSSRFGDEVTTTAVSCGDPKYLLAAMRLAEAQAELPATLLAFLRPEDDEALMSRELTGRPEARPSDHPEEDCSADRAEQPARPSAANSNAAATDELPITSGELPGRHSVARRELFGPVQPPDGLGVTSRQLTRQQRRKLKRRQSSCLTP